MAIVMRRMEQAVFKEIVTMAYEMLLADVVNKYAEVRSHQDWLSFVINHEYKCVTLYWVIGNPFSRVKEDLYEHCITRPVSWTPKMDDTDGIRDSECWNTATIKEMMPSLKTKIVPKGTRKNLLQHASKK
jgi:hypothetical protein